MEGNMKIVAFGGPSHSGKSVLLRALYKLGGFYVVPVQPDGEGLIWSMETKPDVLSKIRRKGDMSNEKLWMAYEEQAKLLRENQSVVHGIILLDMGGRPNENKVRILRNSGAGLAILSREDNFDEHVEKWRGIAEEANARIVAILRSKLEGESKIESTDGIFRAVISGLKRGNEDAVAQDNVVKEFKNFLEKFSEPFIVESADRIDLSSVAAFVGVYNLNWFPECIPRIYSFAEDIQSGEEIKVGGMGPNYVYVALVHALGDKYKRIYIEDPKVEGAKVLVRSLNISFLSGPFDSRDLEDKLLIKLNPENQVLNPGDLDRWRLPDSGGRAVILSGRAPIWLYVNVAETYADIVPWVGVVQPHMCEGEPGYVVTISNDKDKLGEVKKIKVGIT
jgi:hypothetical protein